MERFKEKDFSKRLSAAASARQAVLEKFKARPSQDDPAVAERRAARQALHSAREQRLTERAEARQADEAAKHAAHEKSLQDEQLAKEAALAEQAHRDATLEVERKAARDARYAARKARK
ncbi:DUF6481 family protein [Microvirga sp. 2TAF3]|uniref:DUF6481 family protein n=1 Tax=Microvirga sp. 2TAF3 TaxID=3233014 RepID=UPI003F977642